MTNLLRQITPLKDCPEVARAGRIPMTHGDTLITNPELTRSALFRCGTGERARNATWVEVAASGKTSMWMAGEELRQDDLGVWLGLVKAAEGTEAEKAITFHVRDFAVQCLNLANSSSSVESVKASLRRLAEARLRIRCPRFEGLYSLLSSVEFRGNEATITIAKSALTLLGESTLTAIPLSARAQLRNGPATWMLGFVCGHSCAEPFKLADVHTLMGLKGYDKKAHTKLVKGVMTQLIEVGVVEGFEIDGRKGLLSVTKH